MIPALLTLFTENESRVLYYLLSRLLRHGYGEIKIRVFDHRVDAILIESSYKMDAHRLQDTIDELTSPKTGV